jgi:hypothetical protein
MNVEIGTETPIFLFWEYLFQILGILSLKCTSRRLLSKSCIFFRRPLLVAHAVLLSLVFIIQLASIYTTSELRSGLEHHILNQVKLSADKKNSDDTNV